MASKKPATLKSNLKAMGKDLSTAAKGAIELAPVSVHPLGGAVAAGFTLANLAQTGMNFYERERNRKLGTPRQRAEKAYGEGVAARIKRRKAKGK